MPLKTLADFENNKITKAAELVLNDLVDNHKLRGSMARNVRIALTGNHTTANVHTGFLSEVLTLIQKRRHAIIDLLAQKTCLSESAENANATATALLTEAEQEIKNAIDDRRVVEKRGPREKKVAPLPVKKEKLEFLETYQMTEGLAINIFKEGDQYRIKIVERGEIVKDEFVCADFSVEEGETGRYLSVYSTADAEDAFWGYTIRDDE